MVARLAVCIQFAATVFAWSPTLTRVRTGPGWRLTAEPAITMAEGGGGPALPGSSPDNGGIGGAMRDLRGLWGQIAGPTEFDRAEELQRDLEPKETEDLEYVPQVLVVGATGRLGRIVVRKLVLQGFRVTVLVRSLSTETLNLLGDGVSYSYGDMTDYRTLLDAMEDVDRVVFAANAEDENDELLGLSEVLRSFQDTRTYMYGEAEATKLSLFKMRRDKDFDRWCVETSSAAISDRLASAGLGTTPCIAYWKRSPTGAHRNGIFVGKVFDTYLGSAEVSTSLSGLLLGTAPVMLSAGEPPKGQDALKGAAPASIAAASSSALPKPAASNANTDTVSDGNGALAEVNRAVGKAAAAEVPLNLGEYSGLVIRALGDGLKYTAILRTPEYAKTGLEYHADFVSSSDKFQTHRLPFSRFIAVRDGRPLRDVDAPDLDRRQLTGLALAFYPQRNNPSQATGEFYLSVAYAKAYRKRDEPEIVYISDAAADVLGGEVAVSEKSRVLTKIRGESIIRSSGLTYFIVRPTKLNDKPSSSNLAFTQGGVVTGSVSRADIAEVAVRSLLDPRACNVACTVSDSEAAAPSGYKQDISKALEVLEPNK
mmetsp:Transcript_27240/g.69231  ORF Transcript_27240/g.69231 Transcript_27240/m.69231 type:complete len:596 (-) Transcript_27240:410-2197(-)